MDFHHTAFSFNVASKHIWLLLMRLFAEVVSGQIAVGISMKRKIAYEQVIKCIQ